MKSRIFFAVLGLLVFPAWQTPAEAGPLLLHARSRILKEKGTAEYRVVNQTLKWDPKKTAVIICDMWDQHWCQGASARVTEMAPRMDEVIKASREKGMFIIHAPSSTMEFYQDAPQRKRAQIAPLTKPPVDVGGWHRLNREKEEPLPIDDSDGGCDDLPKCPSGSPWKRQIAALEIASEDAVSDSGPEIYNLLVQRGIDNVIIMGVHANMCVLGRPFAIRQMVTLGKNVVLVRDLTDTMYNSRMKPYVNHFTGTDLLVEHIEKYWCPSITSDELAGGRPFRFKEARSASDHPPAGP